jgi:hypothetical protein
VLDVRDVPGDGGLVQAAGAQCLPRARFLGITRDGGQKVIESDPRRAAAFRFVERCPDN